jgi:heme oxygenase
VKKARLAQHTGMGERNVTAYGIAGDNVSTKCFENLVSSDYEVKMKERRKMQHANAAANGEEPRSKEKYEEDIKRGPRCTANIVNHALSVHKQIQKMRQDIGADEYKRRHQMAFKSLTLLEEQGTTARVNAELEKFEASSRKPYKESARE